MVIRCRNKQINRDADQKADGEGQEQKNKSEQGGNMTSEQKQN